MTPFPEIYAKAAKRHGMDAIAQKLADNNHLKTPAALKATPDDRFLAQMTKCVFQSGFNWKVIDNKWQGFEDAFQGFDIDACAFLSDDALDDLAQDTRIVRNRMKIESVPGNARMIRKVRDEKGSFGKFLADWPRDDQAGLATFLLTEGSRLGAMTGQYFLRFSGWDGYIFSKDCARALIEAGVVDGPVTSKAAIQKAQAAFNAWHQESGRPYSEISRILALSTDAK